jgi:hypothetical protein
MAEHSKEPWGVTVIGDCNRIRITDADGFTISNLDTEVLEGKQPANAKRMRACVNALAGLKPEKIEGLMGAVGMIVEDNMAANGECEQCYEVDKHESWCYIDILQRALAEVKAP